MLGGKAGRGADAARYLQASRPEDERNRQQGYHYVIYNYIYV